MTEFLPNYRLLMLKSSRSGKDWYELVSALDKFMADANLELAQDEVFFIFSGCPSNDFESEGECRVGRPVVGLKQTMTPPWMLLDLDTAPVKRFKLSAHGWEDVIQESHTLREKLVGQGNKLSEGFFLVLSRKLKGELQLGTELEIIFSLSGRH
jgi:hypothetical protein